MHTSTLPFSRALSAIRRLVTGISPAEATVISFLLMSVIGGGILYWTESGRMVVAKVPVLETVNVSLPSPEGDVFLNEEVHAFARETEYRGERFIDALFTAVSALCVTGLTSTDFSQFTLTGQIITMVLIQMGGLGIIVFTSIFALLIARGLSEQQSFKELLASVLDTSHHEVRRMLHHVIMYTILIEGAGFLLMGLYLNGDPSKFHGINNWWWALFHSVSAFNNAGFGLLNDNLVQFADDTFINLCIAGLIILGGLGYPVLIAMHVWLHGWFAGGGRTRVHTALAEDAAGVVASRVQTRVAVWGTVLLLAAGTFIPLALEWNSPVLAQFSPLERLVVAFFQSTSTRTAGFNTIDIGALTTATLFLYMVLMFIGANPAGTAGGIKIPTLAVLYGYVKDWFQRPGLPVILFGRRISKFAVSHAIRLFFFSAMFITLVAFLICIIESKYLMTPDPLFNFTKVIFEIFSAFGTVGLSMSFSGGFTSFSALLHPLSKFLIILTMLFGRLGPLTILAALPWKRRSVGELSPDFDDVDKIQIG